MTTLIPSGLRGRLLLLFLAAFAVMLGMFAWHALAMREEDISAAKERVSQSVKLIASEQSSLVEHADQLLRFLTLLPGLRLDSSPDACSRVLARLEKLEKRFFNIGLVKTNGDVACMAVATTASINLADRTYFKRALRSHELVISDVITSRSTGKSTIVFARGIWNGADQASGVAFVALDLSWLEQELAKVPLPVGSQLAVVDSLGILLAHYPNSTGQVGKSIAEFPLFKWVTQKGEEVTAQLDLAGKPHIFAFTPLMNVIGGRVYLWVGIPKDIVTGPAQREFMISTLIALGLLVAIFGMVWIGSERWLLRPISALSAAARAFGEGNLAARTGLNRGNDELGQLARSFDDMAEAIQSREKQVGRVNRALRVLSAANRTLLGAKDERSLIEDMCRAIVEVGGYRIAWVGYAEHDPRKSVRTVAAWGITRDFLDDLRITWDETESGGVPAGRAIRLGVPVVSNDIQADPAYAAWRELVRRHGVAASLALPLRVGGEVIGALCVCAAEVDAFDEDEVEILSEAAGDLALGIATQRAAVEHGRTRIALESAEERFRAAASANLDALFILKSVRGKNNEIVDFEFTDLNPSAERMLGMKRDQVVGQKLCELLPINRTGGFFDKYVTVATSGTPLEEEFPIDTPEIKAKWLRHQVVRVDDGIAISSRDITEWKQTGAALRESEERFRNATETARDAFAIVEAEGGTIRAWNSAAEAIFGYSKEEVIGRSVHDFLSPTRVREAARHAMEHFAKTGEGAAIGKTTEHVAVRKGGAEFPIELSLSAMQIHGKWHATGIMRDITKRKKSESQIANLNRALRTLSACNVALVHVQSEKALFETVCRHIVDTGGYRVAFIGFCEDDAEKTVSIAAQHGAEAGYLESLGFTWAGTDKGQGTVGGAIRSGAPQVSQNIMTDPKLAAWRAVAARLEIRASISLPLKGEDAKVFGVLTIGAAEADTFDADELQLLAELADDIAFGIMTLRTRAERDRIAYAHAHHAEILQKSLEQSIRAIADTVDARDPYTAGHQHRVAQLAEAIAHELGLPEEKIHGIYLAATVHDLGKIRVPAEILSKPGKLSDIEFMLIKTHPQAGYDILKDVEFPWPIADMVWQHHERLDGSGYPQGLKDGQILLESRIMTVADVVEAMASHRPYRAALGIEVALKEIERGRGSAYDAAVADACLKLFREGRFAFQG